MNKNNLTDNVFKREKSFDHSIMIIATIIVLLFACVFRMAAKTNYSLNYTKELNKKTSSTNQVQRKTITGVVVDSQNEPIIGANILEKGTSNGTVTDFDGNFNLNVNKNAVLRISYIGYLDKEINTQDQETVRIVLQEDTKTLDELIVVGYGTQKRANLTGAVDQVSSDVFDNRPISNLNQGLQGLMANVNIRPMDGNPSDAPSINIRGTTSIGAGGEALILIDGVEGDPSLVNPNDIESVSVLKDAASASIYGARGAFGVVLITTKKASKDRVQVTYSTNYSIKRPTKTFNHVTDSYTFAKMFNEAHLGRTDYATPPLGINKTIRFSQEYLAELKRRSEDPSLPKIEVDSKTGEYVYYENTDWYKELQKSSLSSNEHNLSLSGASEKTSFYLSGRYYFQEGLFRYNSDDYKTGNIRAQGSTQLFPWLEVSNNFEYSQKKYHYPIDGAGEGVGPWAMIALEHFPMSTLHNPDGTLTYSAAYGVGDFWYGKNAIDEKINRFRNTTGLSTNFLESRLRINADFTYTYTGNDNQITKVPVPYSVKPGVIELLGASKNSLEKTSAKSSYISANLYGEFEETFEDLHYIKIMAGVNYEESVYERLFARRDGLLFPDAEDLNLAVGENMQIEGGFNKWKTLGSFFRLNYIYSDRYLLEINGRYDGSSKFPDDERFAFFPSISLGWRATEEKWWNVSDDFLSDMKIRGSYGSLGNGNIGAYRFQELYNVNAQHSMVLGGARPSYTSIPTVIPAGLTWETSTTTNIGIDIGFIKNKLQVVADVYSRKTTDMFTFGPSLPAVFGASPPRGNYADLETKGWELSVHWHDKLNLADKLLNYNIRLTLADNTSKILKYNNPDKRLTDYYEGQKIGDIWGYVTDGFFVSQEDIDNHADQSYIQASNGRILLPGDLKFKDLNGDGKINAGDNTLSNPGDRKIIGNEMPRYTYGIMIGADWNNFFFNAFFQGVGKQDWYPSGGASNFWGQYNRTYNTIPKWHLDPGIIWSEENPDSYFPRYRGHMRGGTTALNKGLSSQTKYLQNVAYIRLKNIQFGYNLPQHISSKIQARAIRVYVGGENLWVWSPLHRRAKDIDPEGIRRSDSLVRPSASYNAGDGYNYPMLGSVIFGLSVTF